jgi:DNA processing protein
LLGALGGLLGPVQQMSLPFELGPVVSVPRSGANSVANSGANSAAKSVARVVPRVCPIPEGLDPVARGVLELLSIEGCGLDSIVDRCGLGVGQVSGLLLQLELEGLVVQLPGMLYQRAIG